MESGFSEDFLRYPLSDTRCEIGGRDWTIRAVENQDALLEGNVDYDRFPFGLLLWESAVGLARHLAERPEQMRGKRVLELGAGVGMAGMVAQWLGARVWQTDHQPDALALAQVNAANNGVGTMRQFLADWRLWNHSTQYQVLLGADILYERAMRPHLAAVFAAALEPGGTLLLADPGREPAAEAITELRSAGWRFEVATQSVLLTGAGRDTRPVEVQIYTGKR